MRLWKLPDQVVRLAILLIAALAILLVARAGLTPPSFGQLGHYRADAIAAVSAQEVRYGGWQLCVECHDAEGDARNRSYHRSISCEVCHGPAHAHAMDFESQTPVIPRERGAACLYCHEYLPSRPTGFPQILEAMHNPRRPCIGCHDPHDPTPPHVPEACSACHAQIARTKSVSHHVTLSCETCHEAESGHRQSPRAFLPRKPARREFCGGCHGRDAAVSADIPRVDLDTHGRTYLCWQCHYPHFPES